MSRPAPLLIAAAILATGCVGDGSRTPSALPPTGTRTSSTQDDPTRLPELVLTADLSEAPVRWDLVTSIPLGPREHELYYEDDPNKVAIPDFTDSFTVGPDGTLWILDEGKHRVAHYDADGRYLGARGGLHYDRQHPRPRDVAFSDGELRVLHYITTRTYLLTQGPDGPSGLRQVMDGERPVLLYNLVPAQGTLGGYLSGWSLDEENPEELGGGPFGYGRVDFPGSGTVALLPGVPLGGNRWMWVRGVTEHELVVEYTTDTLVTQRPIRIDVVPSSGEEPLYALAGGVVEVVRQDAVGLYVSVSPSRPEDAERYGGGYWYLEVNADGDAVVWERLPTAGLADEIQVRHLATGPDGAVYLMLGQEDRMEIYRRP